MVRDPDVWTLIGLITGTIGAILLGYDAVFGAGQRFKDEVRRLQLENLRRHRKRLRDSTNSLPQPPYTPSEIKRLLDEEEATNGPEERKLEAASDRFGGTLNRYEIRVVTYGLIGVLMVVLAFGLQALGLVIHMRQTTESNTRTGDAPRVLPDAIKPDKRSSPRSLTGR